MPIRQDKFDELQARMEKLNIFEKDLIEKFILGSGKGGQKIQKTSSCVYLKHTPTGFEVKCQKDRSREMNRFYARRMLCDKIESDIFKIQTEKQKEIDKIRKQKKKRSKKAKEKILEEKRKRSVTKQLRQPPSSES